MMSKKKKTAFGALDVFVILLIFMCAAGIAVRYVMSNTNGVLASAPRNAPAAVQFLISSIEDTSQDQFSEGGALAVGDVSGEILSVTVTPAEYYAENENGELYIAYEDRSGGKIDIRCTVVVNGWYEDNGVYMLGGNSPLIPGASITLSAGDVKVTGLIIDVTPFVE